MSKILSHAIREDWHYWAIESKLSTKNFPKNHVAQSCMRQWGCLPVTHRDQGTVRSWPGEEKVWLAFQHQYFSFMHHYMQLYLVPYSVNSLRGWQLSIQTRAEALLLGDRTPLCCMVGTDIHECWTYLFFLKEVVMKSYFKALDRWRLTVGCTLSKLFISQHLFLLLGSWS